MKKKDTTYKTKVMTADKEQHITPETSGQALKKFSFPNHWIVVYVNDLAEAQYKLDLLISKKIN